MLVGDDLALGTSAIILSASTLAADGAARTMSNPLQMDGNSVISGDQGLTLSGTLALAINATLTKSGNSALTLSGPQSHQPGTALAINEGTIRLMRDGGPNLAVNVSAPGAVAEFQARQHLAALNVSAGSAVLVAGS